MATGRNARAQPADLSGDVLSALSSHSKDLSASFAIMAAQMQQITFYQYVSGRTLSGTCRTYDQSIIDHALRVRQRRDEMFPATTSRDTEASTQPGES